MNPTNTTNEPNDEELSADIIALLGDEATWAPVSDELEASTIASILAEVDLAETAASPHAAAAIAPGVAGASAAAELPANVIPMPSRWKSAALGAAAALLVVAGIFGLMGLTAPGPDLERALAGTDLAPEASADAEITLTDEGTRIVITVADLPPAAPGTYYQAWLRQDAEVGVSAGTFHLRDGDGPIELWAGVSYTDYPLLTVTLQQEAQTESSGQVVLKALLQAP